MPRFRPSAKLERSAVADLWKHTLSRIPTVTGRLVYLSTLRDVNSGTYRHHGLSTAFGRDESVRALKGSHQQTFRDWLTLTLAEKHDDLKQYLLGLDVPQVDVVAHWLQSGAYRACVPASAMVVETELFSRDLEILLELLQNEAFRRQRRSAADAQDLDSSPLV